MLSPKDRNPALNYREVALNGDEYLAVLPVRVPDWWRDRETVVIVKVNDHGGPVSCALARDFT